MVAAKPEGTIRSRQSVHVDARMFFSGNRPSRECLVTEISDDGACLCIGFLEQVPQTFVLLFADRERASRVCELIWHRGDRIGVRFAKE